MSNEEIKAPVIEGWKKCSYHDWLNNHTIGGCMYLRIENESFYYKRIKPKEKSINEIIDEECEWSFNDVTQISRALERILSNYVKKEG